MTKNCIISVALMLLAICPSASALRASDDIVKKDVVITTQNKNIYDRDGSHGVTVRNVSVINGGKCRDLSIVSRGRWIESGNKIALIFGHYVEKAVAFST